MFSRLCDINHTILVKRVADEINLKRQLKIGIVDANLIGRDKHRFPIWFVKKFLPITRKRELALIFF